MALTAALLAVPAVAVAQEPAPERGETVFDRNRPDFDAKGIPAGGFRVFPSLTVRQAYDDNVFATDVDEEGDFITLISPEIDVRSEWSRHSLVFNAFADIERFADFDNEDAEEYGAAVRGTLDVTARDEVRALAGYSRQVEGRTDPDQAVGVDRNEFDDYRFGAGYTHDFNRISVQVDGLWRELDFIGDRLRERDRQEFRFESRVSYDVSPRFDLFVEPFYVLRDYDVRTAGGADQDSQTFGILGGGGIDITGILFGEVGAGVFYDEFESSARDEVTGFALSAALDWNVTELTTLRARASNESEATNVGGASTVVTTEAAIAVEHELMRNVLIGADAYFQMEDFQGISRTDDTYGGGLEVQYLVNSYFSVFAEYQHETQDSDAAGNDYSINVVLVGLRGQF